jgi:hypothetical protein
VSVYFLKWSPTVNHTRRNVGDIKHVPFITIEWTFNNSLRMGSLEPSEVYKDVVVKVLGDVYP